MVFVICRSTGLTAEPGEIAGSIKRAENFRQKEQDMRTSMNSQLMATSAAAVLGMLVMALPASAQQGQMRGEGGGAVQTNDNVRGGGEMRGSADVRGGRNERAIRGRTESRSDVRVNAQDRSSRKLQSGVRPRNDVRVRADVNTNVRSGVRTERRQSWNGDARWRDDRGRYSDRAPRVRVGVGYDEPGYAYRIYNDGYAYGGYDDGYYSSGYSEPYATRGYSDTYYGYAASPGCTCSPAPYAAWNSGNRWDGGGWGVGFSAW